MAVLIRYKRKRRLDEGQRASGAIRVFDPKLSGTMDTLSLKLIKPVRMKGIQTTNEVTSRIWIVYRRVSSAIGGMAPKSILQMIVIFQALKNCAPDRERARTGRAE